MKHLLNDARRMFLHALMHSVVIVFIFSMVLSKRLLLVNLMKLPHEAGSLPTIPWYYKVAWCIDPANHPTPWTGDPFCFAIDVRVVFAVLLATICLTEVVWRHWKKRKV